MKPGRKKGTIKTGGRQPGSQNKTSAELKTWISAVIEDNKSKFVENLAKVDPEKHIAIIEKLMSYIVAKPQSLDISMEYKELEALLTKTPDQYIEKITMKLIELNTKNNLDHETENE